MKLLICVAFLLTFFAFDIFADGPVYNFNFNHGTSAKQEQPVVEKKQNQNAPQAQDDNKQNYVQRPAPTNQQSNDRFRFRLAGMRILSDDSNDQEFEPYVTFKPKEQAMFEVMYRLSEGLFFAGGLTYMEYNFGRTIDGPTLEPEKYEETSLPKQANSSIYGFSTGLDFRPKISQNFEIPLGARYQYATKKARFKTSDSAGYAESQKVKVSAIQIFSGLSFHRNNMVYEALVNYTRSKMNVIGSKYNNDSISGGLAIGIKI